MPGPKSNTDNEYVFTCPLCVFKGTYEQMGPHVIEHGMTFNGTSNTYAYVCSICNDKGNGFWTDLIQHCFTAHTVDEWKRTLTTKVLEGM